MHHNSGFYTLKGFSLMENSNITSSMEDYLEMIYRFYSKNQPVRINKLSEALHVKPSSASKMAVNLKKQGLVDFQKYGSITLTEKGKKLGKYLIFRHNTLNRLLCYINNSQDELEQVEKIEHFINTKTVYNIKKFLDNLK